MLVIDASVVVAAAAVSGGLDDLGDPDLVAPGLMWSEARSALHERVWREEVRPESAEIMRERIAAAPIQRREPDELGDEAWRLADELGWARTYDAEYVALARLLGCRLVTVDRRLRRGADRLGFVVTPSEL